MHNEILWLIFAVIDLCIALVAFRIFGKNGLFAIIVMNIILANIQVLKTVQMFGLVVTLGNILYGSIFFATDVLCEVYGKEEAKKGVWLGFFVLIATTLVMQISLQFIPDPSDFIHGSLENIFGFFPRIALASITAYIISQNFDVWAFSTIKKKTKGKLLWLRNNASTWISQLIDSLIFTTIAFLGVWDMTVFWQVMLTTYLFKIVVAIIDTPFIYIAKRISGSVSD